MAAAANGTVHIFRSPKKAKAKQFAVCGLEPFGLRFLFFFLEFQWGLILGVVFELFSEGFQGVLRVVL